MLIALFFVGRRWGRAQFFECFDHQAPWAPMSPTTHLQVYRRLRWLRFQSFRTFHFGFCLASMNVFLSIGTLQASNFGARSTPQLQRFIAAQIAFNAFLKLIIKKCAGRMLRHRAHPDLNQGPADLQSAALTTELCTHLPCKSVCKQIGTHPAKNGN